LRVPDLARRQEAETKSDELKKLANEAFVGAFANPKSRVRS
jgi:hypothetical protein